MKNQQSSNSHPPDDLGLEFLTVEQVLRIDQLLADVRACEHGEVHLIVQKGELRFIKKVESFKASG